MIGKTISHYQIVDKPGEGGMGAVYKALDTKLDRSPRAHYFLGRANEQSGWTDRAIGQYEEVLAIWASANPGQPGHDDVKQRLVRLRAAPTQPE